MNAQEIYQKRIDEAEKKIIQEYVESFKYENGMELEPVIKIFLEKIGTTFFDYGISFALQNQWISVDEALPEVDGHGYSKPVLVMSDTNELLVATYSKIYDKWNVVGPVSYHRLVVTHWMPIPSLEGGEK